MSETVVYRQAVSADIPQIQVVRHSVKENQLSDPSLVPDSDVEDYINRRGRGWVCEVDGKIVGFSIADLVDNNVWALFLHPDFEARGIGKKLHRLMMDWYFGQTKDTIWLGTAPASRAETFYRMQGWKEVGKHGDEVKFEIAYEDWNKVDISE